MMRRPLYRLKTHTKAPKGHSITAATAKATTPRVGPSTRQWHEFLLVPQSTQQGMTGQHGGGLPPAPTVTDMADRPTSCLHLRATRFLVSKKLQDYLVHTQTDCSQRFTATCSQRLHQVLQELGAAMQGLSCFDLNLSKLMGTVRLESFNAWQQAVCFFLTASNKLQECTTS